MNLPIHGVQVGTMSIQAMKTPYRKKKGLFIYDDSTNTFIKVATFNNDESAYEFMNYLLEFCQNWRQQKGGQKNETA